MSWWDTWWLRALNAVLIVGLVGWLLVFGSLVFPASWDARLFNAGIALIVDKFVGFAALVIAESAIEAVRWIQRGAPMPEWSSVWRQVRWTVIGGISGATIGAIATVAIEPSSDRSLWAPLTMSGCAIGLFGEMLVQKWRLRKNSDRA